MSTTYLRHASLLGRIVLRTFHTKRLNVTLEFAITDGNQHQASTD